MANYATLKAALDAAIYTNTRRAITGDILNAKMDEMINALGAGYQYMGEATPSTNPGSPDSNVVYLATTAGTYTNFGDLTLASGKIAFLRWNGSWAKDEISVQAELIIDSQPTSGSGNPVSSGGVHAALQDKQDTIEDVVVSVNDQTGTPSGSASMSGNRLILSFSNLKGATGETGPEGKEGKQGPRGPQGNPGSSQDYPFELENDPSVGGTAKASTAEAVKTVNDQLTGEGCNYDYGVYLFSTGAYGGDSDSGITAFIPAKAGDVVEWHHGYNATGNKCLLCYDSNKAFISGQYWTVNAVTTRTLTLGNSSTAYIRASFSLSAEEAYITINGEVVWSKKDGYIGIKEDVNNVNELLGINGITCFMMNGTTSNTGNASIVHTSKVPVEVGKTYKFYTDRPLPEGYRYIFGYSTYSNATYGSWNQNRIRNVEFNLSNPVFDLPVTINAGEVALVFMVGVLDGEGSIVALRSTDFIGYTCLLVEKSTIEELLEELNTPAVVSLNKDRQVELSAICRLNKSTSAPYKDIELLICSDEHNDSTSAQRAIDAANGFPTVDAYINCGDIMQVCFSQSEVETFQQRFATLKKPGFVVVGNHDAGNAYFVGNGATHVQAYDAFIKPMIDKGYLSSGEYSAGLPYWYHDNATYKVRLIGLYEFDAPLDLSDSDYWEPVTYDSSAAKIAFSTSYTVGTVVNCGSYTNYSFRCKSPVTTPANYYTDTAKLPRYRIHRGMRCIRQDQAQWFLSTLASTPANYGVIVVIHQPISNSAEVVNSKFTQANTTGIEIQSVMATDFIAEALAAFSKGINYSQNVIMNGEASYMNELSSGGISYAYSVSQNFANKNTGAHLLGVIGGHRHKDVIYKLDDIYQVDVVCANTERGQSAGSDIRRSLDTSIARDSLTVVSLAQGRIGLAKLGVNVTENGTARDYEVINTSE